jgi:hypothetical protein
MENLPYTDKKSPLEKLFLVKTLSPPPLISLHILTGIPIPGFMPVTFNQQGFPGIHEPHSPFFHHQAS